jgi:multidrug efflux pump subunit AcrA (membrane-fusion protein)
MKKINKKLFISLICITASIVIYLQINLKKKILLMHTVTFGEINSTKQYIGSLRPSVTFYYDSEYNKEVVWRTETGIDVKKKDPVLKFQTADLEEEIESHTEGVVDKEAALAGIVLQNQSEISKAELETKEMALRVEIDKFNLELAKNDPSDLIRKEQELLLKKDFVRKSFLESKFKTFTNLYEKGLVSETALQTAKVNLVRAESDYLKTNIRHNDRLAGTSPLRIKKLEKQLELSTLRYEDSLVNEKNLKEIHRLNEIRVKEDVFTIKNKIDRFKRFVSTSTVYAPFDGKVYFPSIYKGAALSGEPIEIGETPIRGVGLLFFTNSSDFDVDFIVAESELNKIKIGGIINFELKSNQIVKIGGVIKKLSEIASDKNILLGDLALERKGEANVRVVQVSAKLNNGHPDLRQGITGIVSLIESSAKCLVIPQNSVKVINHQYFVINNKNEKKEITLGKNDGFLVEVLTGLTVGDIIINE